MQNSEDQIFKKKNLMVPARDPGRIMYDNVDGDDDDDNEDEDDNVADDDVEDDDVEDDEVQ
jgi:hypothetical protein